MILGGIAIIQLKGWASIVATRPASLYFFIAFVYFLTFVYAVLINQLRSMKGLAYLQLAGDVFFITLLIYLSGLAESPFVSGYILVIIAASILLYRRGAIVAVAGSVGAYSLLLFSSYFGWIQPLAEGTVWPRTVVTNLSDLSSSLLVNLSAFFMVAALSSYLSEQLRRTGQQLEAREIDYRELDALNKSLFHSIATGVITTDLKGLVTSMNRAGGEMLGKKLKDVYQLPLLKLFPGMARFCRETDSGIQFTKKHYGTQVQSKDGDLRYFSFHHSPLTNSKREQIGCILDFEDITHYQELEERARLEEKLARQKLAPDGEEELAFQSMVGKSSKMQEVYQLIRRIGPTNSNIMIQGGSGTGKELVARAIHYQSPRRDLPFLPVNLSAIPETLIESELFGHMKGSFTGAVSDKPGLLEVARGGSLFLDEIGELSPATQVKILRVIQEKTFRRLGGTKDHSLDVRFISATNKDLWDEVQKGNFREDLYYRLNVIQLDMPPLRERGDDIVQLAHYFVEKHAQVLKKPVKKISAQAMKLLLDYSYPGNVRELENIIERGMALEDGDILTADSLPAIIATGSPSQRSELSVELPEKGLNLDAVLGGLERGLLVKALARVGGVKRKAAGLLQVSFRSFRYRLAKYDLGKGENLFDD